MTANAHGAGRLARIAGRLGAVLVLFAVLAAVVARILPAMLSVEVVAAAGAGLGLVLDDAGAAAIGQMVVGWVRTPVIVALGVGLLLVLVGILTRPRKGDANERGPIGDHEAWSNDHAPHDDDEGAASPARKILVIVVGVMVLAGLLFFGARWAGVSLPGNVDSPDDDIVAAPPATQVLITEVVSSNGSLLADDDGDWSDYIELHNPTEEPVNLAGHYLSDDDGEPDRWRLPEVTIEPGGYLLVWASGKDRDQVDGQLHTDFALAQESEPVLLVAPDGETTIDRVGPLFMPRDVAWGRDPADADRFCYFAVPTPGEANAAECFDDIDLGAPTLSATSGFYEQPFGLEITVPDPSATIIYTLDGSFPDLGTNPDRTLIYDGPLRIIDRTSEPERLARISTVLPDEGGGPSPLLDPFDERIQKATVLRARSTHSAETVATYFVGPDFVRDSLPVVSLVLDEEFLFDHEPGIYVAGRVYEDYYHSDEYDPDRPKAEHPANYNQWGRNWERPRQDNLRSAVVFEHCAPGGICDFQRNVGLRIHGGATRTFPQKSLRLYARNDYGDRVFTYPFFQDRAPVDQRRLLLRNSGNDQGRTKVMDAYLQGLMAGFNADTQAHQPAVVFLNGEYWGIHNFRERYDQHYLELYYDADPNTVVAFEGGLYYDDHGRALLEFLQEQDPTSDQTLARIEAEVDLDSWIDFLIAHVYVGNPDWPGRNERLWRQPDGPHAIGQGVLDGRWRWQIVDLDQMGGGLNVYNLDVDLLADRLAPTDDIGLYGGVPFMFNRLMQHPEVADRFVTRYADLLNTNFRVERASAYLDEVVAEIESEVPRHVARYREFGPEFWGDQLELLNGFMVQRPDAVRAQLVERFELGAPTSVNLSTDASRGAMRINTRLIDASTPGVADPGDWQGIYFDGMHLTLEAVAWSGHRFIAWDGLPDDQGLDPTDPRVTLTLDGTLNVTAIFEPN